MDGKLFLLDKATPPPMSQVAATTFTFDLQRFTDVDTLDALKTALESGGEIKLTADITGDTNTLNISKDTTLDLNGHTLTTGAQIGVQVKNGVTFNLEDSTANAENVIGNGEIKSTFTSTDSAKKVLRDQDKAAVVMVGENVGSTNNATFTMTSGKISSELTSDSATDGSGRLIGVDVIGESTFNLSGGSVKSSESLAVYFGTIGNTAGGKFVSNNGEGGGGTFNMTGGTLESNASEDLSTIQVSGNHVKSTTINISGGEVIYKRALKDNDTDSRGAIFSSGVSNITISDSAKITSTHVGIEMRAGTLNVTGGTIESTSNEPIEYNKDTNAAFRQGVAIAVAQSSTAKNININIEGGTVKGYSALTVANPKSLGTSDNAITSVDSSSNHNGEPESGTDYRSDTTTYKIGTVSVNVKGGTLTSNGTGNDSFSQIDSDDANKGYTLSGKHAIANLDSRVNIGIENATVDGGIVALTTGRTGTGYNIGTGNTFTSFNVADDDAEKDVLLTYSEFGSSNDFKVSKLGKGEAFNRPDKDATEWKYLTGSGSTVASIGSAAEDSDTLELTMGALSGAIPNLGTAAEIDFTSNLFSKYNNATKFDGSAAPASFPLNIKGNDKITSISGGAGNDSIKPGEVDSVTVTLTGGEGADLFFFDGNSNTITDFGKGDDSVTLANSKFRPANADFLATTDKITIDFGGGDALMFEGLGTNEVSLPGGHIFATRYHAFDKQITFTSVKDDAFDATSEAKFANYATIDAASASAISIMGNSLDNRIIGSNKGGSLNGGEGNDRLIVTDREAKVKYLFEHTAGKDSIEGFDDTKDTLAITPANITEAKGSGSKLTLTFGKDNSVVLKSDVDIEKVALQDDNYLTSSGYFSTDTFKLFANAKGKIDLTDTPYKDTGIEVIDASDAKKQSVTLTADKNVTTVKLAENNKKDLFVYGGGAVSISGYEAGTDKLNIADVGAVSLFTVGTNGVSINAGGTNTISLQGALADQEILIRDGGKSNSYQKFVFHADGVLYNKAKKPTEANIYSNVDKDAVVQAADSVKKIFLQAGVSGASIQSGNNKATLDASEANGVSLIGGAKNNKFIASAGDDLFVYKGGKDNIQDFDAKDEITLEGDFDLNNAKISASSKSLKFKFTNKNTLTLKSDSKITSASINGGNYTFSKNAVGLNGVVSLTNAFSGSYNLAKSTAIGNTVNGSAVKKNLTFKGTDAAESLSGGQKKTTFKGGGGDDIFYGGTGKDVFFYAKTDSGNKTIENFDFGSNNDKIKIASGTIKTISKSGDNITFSTNGGSLTVTKDENKNVLLKANNTFYWFADSTTAGKTDGVSVGDLITADTKVSNAQAVATGYDVIDLGYSTNLVKTNLATKAGSFTFNGGITKNNTTT